MRTGRLGRDQVRMMMRHGLTVIQRLHREACSEHGDSLTLGCRGTMRPYGTTVEEAATYLESVKYPTPGMPTSYSRGGFPLRQGDHQVSIIIREGGANLWRRCCSRRPA